MKNNTFPSTHLLTHLKRRPPVPEVCEGQLLALLHPLVLAIGESVPRQVHHDEARAD